MRWMLKNILRRIILDPVLPVRPARILILLLCYGLGLSLANFLGVPLNIKNAILGLLWLITAQYLGKQATHGSAVDTRRELEERNRKSTELRYSEKTIWLFWVFCIGLFSLTLITNFIIEFQNEIFIWLILFSSFLVFYYTGASSKDRFRNHNLRIIDGCIHPAIVPAFSYALQSEELHRFLLWLCIPLVLFVIFFFLIDDIVDFERQSKVVLLKKLGPARYINLSIYLLICGFVFLIISGINKLPWFMIWPTFISFPIYAMECILLLKLLQGSIPKWKTIALFNYSSISFIFYAIYLTLWIH